MTTTVFPDLVEAHEPPEAAGRSRDDVRLLVADRAGGGLEHRSFCELPRLLAPGDLLVVNTSGTLAAALPARHRGEALTLHLSTPAGDGGWLVELRTRGGSRHAPLPPGARLELPGAGSAVLGGPAAGSERLVHARLELPVPLTAYLAHHGRPIRYGYVPAPLPLDLYQTIFALEPGSAEMPSAGRPFTPALVTELVARGILVAPVTLHTGVSSLELGERPYAERFHVPEATARLVNAVRGWGGRTIAVGTTVVRALETAAGADGTVSPARGWTDLVLTGEGGVCAVDGLLTGWHEPRSSHLQVLEAVGGSDLIERSYAAAAERGYRSHEFGDLHLILATRRLG